MLRFSNVRNNNVLDSVKAAAKQAAESVLSMYAGNQPGQVPGIFLPVDVYYWWLGGAAWNVSSRKQVARTSF